MEDRLLDGLLRADRRVGGAAHAMSHTGRTPGLVRILLA